MLPAILLPRSARRQRRGTVSVQKAARGAKRGPLRLAGLGRPVRASFEPLNQAYALFTIEPKKGLENEFDGVRMLLGHDDRARRAAPAADISRAEQRAWSEWHEAEKISPEAHG